MTVKKRKKKRRSGGEMRSIAEVERGEKRSCGKEVAEGERIDLGTGEGDGCQLRAAVKGSHGELTGTTEVEGGERGERRPQ